MPVPIPMTNYYEILELQPDASDEDIRVAYKKLVSWQSFRRTLYINGIPKALKWHPDRHLDDKDNAQTKFVEVWSNTSTCHQLARRGYGRLRMPI